MSLEQSIQNLADAINRLAEAQSGRTDTLAGVSVPSLPGTRDPNRKTQEEEAAEYEARAPKRARGRPRKVESEPVATADEFQSETPVAAPTTIDVATLRHTLIEVVKQKGRDACGELCRKHGGPNLSALNPAVYPELYADAQALLATDAQ